MDIPDIKRVDVGGASLPYLHYKGGSSQIVFMHATGFLPWLWHPIIREFAPQSSVWAPFINDYRICDPHEGGLSWDVIAEDLSVFCRELHIDRPLMVGHSMGATVSAIAVAKYGVKASGMVLIEPVVLPEKYYSQQVSVKSHPFASKAIRRRNHWKNEHEAWTYLKSRVFFSDWDEEVLDLYFKYGMLRQETGDLKLACSPQSEAAIFIGGRAIVPWPLLKEINCPVEVVEGEISEGRAVVDARRIVSLLQEGYFRSVADAHHLIPMQKPQEVVQIIRQFQKRHMP